MAHETLEGLEARYRAPLFAFFRRKVRHADVAEDLTQDVFLRLLRHPIEDTGRPAENLVFTIAGNLLRDHFRRQAVRNRIIAREVVAEDNQGAAAIKDLDGTESLTPERVYMGKEALAVVTAALSEMPTRRRQIFLLFRLERKTHRELAAMYGISPSLVQKELAKAVRAMIKAMNPEGDTP